MASKKKAASYVGHMMKPPHKGKHPKAMPKGMPKGH